MTDVKQAVRAALQYARDVFGADQAPTLEEIERTDDERYWLITLGFERPVPPFITLGGGAPQRDYKLFKIEAGTGQVVSMKIRSVE